MSHETWMYMLHRVNSHTRHMHCIINKSNLHAAAHPNEQSLTELRRCAKSPRVSFVSSLSKIQVLKNISRASAVYCHLYKEDRYTLACEAYSTRLGLDKKNAHKHMENAENQDQSAHGSNLYSNMSRQPLNLSSDRAFVGMYQPVVINSFDERIQSQKIADGVDASNHRHKPIKIGLPPEGDDVGASRMRKSIST